MNMREVVLPVLLWVTVILLVSVGAAVYAMHGFASDCRASGGTVSASTWHGVPDVTTCHY